MQVSHFPAAAANSLIEGYCDDFVSLAAVLSQTLEQVSMRGINIASSTPALSRIENGMRGLAEAIHDLLERLPTMPKQQQPEAPPTQPRTQPAPTPPPARAAQARPAPPSRPPTPGGPPAATPPRATTAPPRRTATATATADPGTLRGTNNSMPLLSVFQFLERTRKSGVLTVELPGETIRFGIASGCVQSCISSAPVAGERVGDLAVAAGIVDSEAVEKAVREMGVDKAQRDGRGLGDALVQRGLMTNGQLLELLEDQVRRRFRRACATHTASYAFTAGDAESSDGRMQIAPMELNHRPTPGPGRRWND